MTYREFLKSGFWADVKYRKLEANPRCERCDSTFRLQVHHRFYRKPWTSVQLGDLETLCNDCHRKQHGKGPSMNEVGRMRAIRRKLRKINKSIPRGKRWRWATKNP